MSDERHLRANGACPSRTPCPTRLVASPWVRHPHRRIDAPWLLTNHPNHLRQIKRIKLEQTVVPAKCLRPHLEGSLPHSPSLVTYQSDRPSTRDRRGRGSEGQDTQECPCRRKIRQPLIADKGHPRFSQNYLPNSRNDLSTDMAEVRVEVRYPQRLDRSRS